MKLLQHLVAHLCFLFSPCNEIKVAPEGVGGRMRTRLLCPPSCVCLLLSPQRQMCNFPVSVSYSLFNSPSPTQDIGSMGTFTPHRHSHPPPHSEKARRQQMSHMTPFALSIHTGASVSVTHQQLNICPHIINQY